ncbi:MAG: hypothetical protein HONBIEJF_01322 [Fimbriimonadaceae bacterium]|nr:hypothetical protein [Fimbriimonadaceae bacterium]
MPTPEYTSLTWTGERMIPNASDVLTEMYHWQRYLYFRPWYVDAAVVDAASGEGYGINYASGFTTKALGIDINDAAVDHGRRRYPHIEFEVSDVTNYDYSGADLVTSFETIEHLEDPSAFLQSLSRCPGAIVVSTPNRETHSPGNQLDDKPLNEFHTVEWTPAEFAKLVGQSFPNRQVRFLSQQMGWPGTVREGLDESAMYTIAVIDGPELPSWPKVGISIPTVDADMAADAFLTLSRTYPGDIVFCLVVNGVDDLQRAKFEKLRATAPKQIEVLYQPRNLGYGVGANIGLDHLAHRGDCEFLAVSNDDVFATPGMLSELVCGLIELQKSGLKPGAIGPVSNYVHGPQQVDLGETSSFDELLFRVEGRHSQTANSVSQTDILRGLFVLFDQDCLAEIGGFDPRFGLGNFEDADHNLRCQLAGYSLWIADGAFLYHKGSQTFQKLGIDYEQSMLRTRDLFWEKWGVASDEDALSLRAKPEGVQLFVPLTPPTSSGPKLILGPQEIDVFSQATNLEFGVWVSQQLRGKGISEREAIAKILDAA